MPLQSFAASLAQVNGLYFSTNSPFWLFPVADSDPTWNFHTYVQLILIILKGDFLPHFSHPILLRVPLFYCPISHCSTSIFNPHVTATFTSPTLSKRKSQIPTLHLAEYTVRFSKKQEVPPGDGIKKYKSAITK